MFLVSLMRAIRFRPKPLAEVIPLHPVPDEPKRTITVSVKLDMSEARRQVLELIDLANEAKAIAESIKL